MSQATVRLTLAAPVPTGSLQDDPPPITFSERDCDSTVSVLNNDLKDFHYSSQLPQMLHFPLPRQPLPHLSLGPQSTTSLLSKASIIRTEKLRSPWIPTGKGGERGGAIFSLGSHPLEGRIHRSPSGIWRT